MTKIQADMQQAIVVRNRVNYDSRDHPVVHSAPCSVLSVQETSALYPAEEPRADLSLVEKVR